MVADGEQVALFCIGFAIVCAYCDVEAAQYRAGPADHAGVADAHATWCIGEAVAECGTFGVLGCHGIAVSQASNSGGDRRAGDDGDAGDITGVTIKGGGGAEVGGDDRAEIVAGAIALCTGQTGQEETTGDVGLATEVGPAYAVGIVSTAARQHAGEDGVVGFGGIDCGADAGGCQCGFCHEPAHTLRGEDGGGGVAVIAGQTVSTGTGLDVFNLHGLPCPAAHGLRALRDEDAVTGTDGILYINGLAVAEIKF